MYAGGRVFCCISQLYPIWLVDRHISAVSPCRHLVGASSLFPRPPPLTTPHITTSAAAAGRGMELPQYQQQKLPWSQLSILQRGVIHPDWTRLYCSRHFLDSRTAINEGNRLTKVRVVWRRPLVVPHSLQTSESQQHCSYTTSHAWCWNKMAGRDSQPGGNGRKAFGGPAAVLGGLPRTAGRPVHDVHGGVAAPCDALTPAVSFIVVVTELASATDGAAVARPTRQARSGSLPVGEWNPLPGPMAEASAHFCIQDIDCHYGMGEVSSARTGARLEQQIMRSCRHAGLLVCWQPR